LLCAGIHRLNWGFAWWRAQGAASYRLVVRDGAGKTACEAANLKDPVHLPDRILAPGEYRWDVEALDSNSAVVARRGEWRFRVPKRVPELAWEDAARILSRAPAEHSRYIFLKSELPRIRQTLKTTRRAAWEALLEQAGGALKRPLPEPPRRFHAHRAVAGLAVVGPGPLRRARQAGAAGNRRLGRRGAYVAAIAIRRRTGPQPGAARPARLRLAVSVVH
jgi:hypothetical protein